MKPNDRRCISCRKVDQKEYFWRIVRVYPSRTVQLDEGMGRSAYLCPSSDCLKAAQRKDRLGRSLKATVPDTIYQGLWQRLSHDTAAQSMGTDRSPQARS
ncbi:YlxR family protein [Leptolyngbya sp. CCY15150]|uniref:YlxR family protein n=1 Tax=Leptolyngbya sp. CCY15150 TaxID=2767772 RepID=UPI001951CF91|nr:YlxR family protein [Leptolyngbya sp. CCY15150]